VSHAEVRAALERLFDARRELLARPVRAVRDALADVLDAWSAPGSAWQKELAAALPASTGFSAPMVVEALASGLAPYTGRALHDLVAAEGEDLDGFDATAAVLAGAIPLPAFVAVAAPLALRSPVLVKPAAHDPATAPLLARSLAERDPALGAAVAIADFRRDDAAALDALCAAPCVTAMGSDEAIAAVAARVGAGRRFVGAGHRFSVALLGPAATSGDALARAARGLARDVALWDQLGCLSPIAVLVADSDPRAADRAAAALADALADAETRWPRGKIEPAVAAQIASERAAAEVRAAAGDRVAVLAARDTAWTIVREADAVLRNTPLHRFVRVHPSADTAAALAALGPHRERLAGAAVAGFAGEAEPLARALRELGVSYMCQPGQLQSPPLAWPRERRPVLRSLAR
jgi:hypothetical protein